MTPSRPPIASVEASATVATDAAAELLIGVMLAVGRGVPDFEHLTGRTPVTVFDGVGTRALARYTGRRLVRRVGRSVRRG